MLKKVSDLVDGVLGRENSVSVRGSGEIDKQLLSELSQSDQMDLRLVYTLLLVDLASIDHDFDDREYSVISASLTKVFGTTKGEVSRLVQQAQSMLKGFRSTSTFAETLRDELPLEKRQELMTIINNVISADGRVDGFEVYLRSRFASLLEVDPE